MIIGTTMAKLDGNPYYSPAFPKGGDAAVFSVQIVNFSATSLTVTVQHRTAEETTWTDAGTFTSITTIGLATKDISGLKELVRFKFLVNGSNVYDAVHVFVPPPSWRPN